MDRMDKPSHSYKPTLSYRVHHSIWAIFWAFTVCGLGFSLWHIAHVFRFEVWIYRDRLVRKPFAGLFNRTLPLTPQTKVGIAWTEEEDEDGDFEPTDVPWIVIETPGYRQVYFRGQYFSNYREIAERIAEQTGHPLYSVAPKGLFSTFQFRN